MKAQLWATDSSRRNDTSAIRQQASKRTKEKEPVKAQDSIANKEGKKRESTKADSIPKPRVD